MRKLILLLVLLLSFFRGSVLYAQDANPFADSVTNRFAAQVNAFPQEKIYLQTDRNHYISGENIWLRAHIVDAVFHKQANASRYIYVELVNPLDSVVQRVKIHPDSLGLFHGNLPTDEGLIEGYYMLRAYTLYMQNIGEDYFFRKTVKITDPMSALFNVKMNFTTSKDNEITAAISVEDRKTRQRIEPVNPQVRINRENRRKLNFDSDNTANITFKIREKEKQRVLTLGFQHDGRIYTRYFSIPSWPENEFDVSFFPEGGHLLAGISNAVGLKALSPDGLSEKISVNIVDEAGTLICNTKTSVSGMGLFNLLPEPGKKYFAECVNEQNVSKRIALPESVNNYCGLSIKRGIQDKLYASAVKTPDYSRTQKLFMLVHTRGVVLYCKEWDDANDYVVFEKDMLPSGVCHFILFDENRNILSERLAFSYNETEMGNIDFSTDSENYRKRQHVVAKAVLTDTEKTLMGGNIAVSVTDDRDVAPDTVNTILTSLLLTSELRGYVENPAFYLKNSRIAQYGADLLMLTQGWRRYPVQEVIQGKIAEPAVPVELFQRMSGKVDGVFTSVKDGFISILAISDSSINAHVAQTDNKGFFEVKDIEYPDGTRFIIQAATKKGGKNVFLTMDKEKPYPEVSILLPYEDEYVSDTADDGYLTKSEERYVAENGARVVNLAEVEIVARKKEAPKSKSSYYSAISSSSVMTADEIEKRRIRDMRSLLMQMSGIMITGDKISIRGGGTPLIVIDDIPYEDYDIFSFMIEDLSDIFLVKDASAGAMFGTRGANGLIVISTKEGFDQTKIRKKGENLSEFIKPLGFQQPVQFYSPRYDVNPDADAPDLRTTIYWKPDIKVSENGEISFDFFAADVETTYTVVIEGVSDYGHIVRKVAKITRTNK